VAVVKTVDQVKISRTTAPRAHRQASCEVSFRACGKSSRLLMSYMNPIKIFPCTNRVCDAVKGVTGNAIDPTHPSFGEDLCHEVRYSLVTHYLSTPLLEYRKPSDRRLWREQFLFHKICSENSCISKICEQRTGI
jgi:hypothetical protein